LRQSGRRGEVIPGATLKDANVPGGEPVVLGTRVPFRGLVDYLKGEYTLDNLLKEYPSVGREPALQAIAGSPRKLFRGGPA